jgi:hypothetical protein
MAAPREPMFLGRETYRRRRVIDALRLLPVIGGFLFLVPLLGAGAGDRSTAWGGVFLFAAWLGLIVASAVLVRLLARAPGGLGPETLDGEPGATGAPPAASERPDGP